MASSQAPKFSRLADWVAPVTERVATLTDASGQLFGEVKHGLGTTCASVQRPCRLPGVVPGGGARAHENIERRPASRRHFWQR